MFNVANRGRIVAVGLWNEGDFARTSGLINPGNTSGKLTIACMAWNLTTDYTWQDLTLPDANTNFMGNTSIGGRNLDVVTRKVHNKLPDSTSVLNTVEQLRSIHTDLPFDRPAGVTDVKFFRVAAWGTKGKIGSHFQGSRKPSGTDKAFPANTNVILLYPAIVRQYFTVSYELPRDGSVSFTVYDIFGRKISEKSIEESKGSNKSVFSVDGLNSGTYFLKFQSENMIETKRFIVSK